MPIFPVNRTRRRTFKTSNSRDHRYCQCLLQLPPLPVAHAVRDLLPTSAPIITHLECLSQRCRSGVRVRTWCGRIFVALFLRFEALLYWQQNNQRIPSSVQISAKIFSTLNLCSTTPKVACAVECCVVRTRLKNRGKRRMFLPCVVRVSNSSIASLGMSWLRVL